MVFWLFKKKEVKKEENQPFDLVDIHQSLRASFQRIKADMVSIRDWLHYFKTKEDDQDLRLKAMENRLEEMGEVITMMQEIPQVYEKKELVKYQEREERPMQVLIAEEEKEIQVNELDILTETQKVIFSRLATMQNESQQQWIPIKMLAQELYPDKPYNMVRSTLSEYFGILIEAALVKKKRKGKLTYVSITEKGVKFFDANKKEGLKKLIAKRQNF